MLLFGIFILPYGVAATDAWEDFANLPSYSFGVEDDKEPVTALRRSGLKAVAVSSDPVVDSGDGWTCYQSYLCLDTVSACDYSNGGRSFNITYSPSSDYPAIACQLSIVINGSSYKSVLLAYNYNFRYSHTFFSSSTVGGYPDGFPSSLVSTTYTYSDVKFNVLVNGTNNTTGVFVSDLPNLGEYTVSNFSEVVPLVFADLGVGLEPSPIFPPADHILSAYNNAPYKLTYWTGAEQAELLSGPYELSNGTSELFSISDLSTFGRQAHNLSPAYDGVLARYTCVKDYDYNVSDYQSITVSGTYKLSLSYTSVSSDNTSFMRIINPDNMYLMVNGDRIGASDIVYDRDSGILTVNHTISLANYGGISSLGVYADYSFSGDIGSGAQSLSVDVRLSDDLTVSTTAAPAETPEPVDNIETMTGGILSLLRDLLNFLFGLVSNIMNGIVSLFVPSADELTGLKDRYTTLLSEKLGFIYDGFAWLGEFIGSFNSQMANSEDYTFHFPGVSYVHPGEEVTEYVLLAEQDVDLDNDLMSVLRPVAGTVVSIAAVLSLINLCFNMFVAVISGKSYMEFWSYQDNVDFWEDREFWKGWYG